MKEDPKVHESASKPHQLEKEQIKEGNVLGLGYAERHGNDIFLFEPAVGSGKSIITPHCHSAVIALKQTEGRMRMM